jgi:hypothetical protein
MLPFDLAKQTQSLGSNLQLGTTEKAKSTAAQLVSAIEIR